MVLTCINNITPTPLVGAFEDRQRENRLQQVDESSIHHFECGQHTDKATDRATRRRKNVALHRANRIEMILKLTARYDTTNDRKPAAIACFV